jgi:hypothetical protein
MGLGHRGTALIAYALMTVCAAAALFGRSQPPAVQGAIVVVTGLMLAAAACFIDLRWRRATVSDKPA